MCTIFIALSAELVAKLLHLWLELKDITRLDTSICNKAQRPLLLTALAHPDYSHDNSNITWNYAKRFFDWVSFRDIKIEILNFSGVINGGEFEQLNRLNTADYSK